MVSLLPYHLCSVGLYRFAGGTLRAYWGFLPGLGDRTEIRQNLVTQLLPELLDMYFEHQSRKRVTKESRKK